MLRQGFAQLPRLVLRSSGLSDKAKILYALLLDYAWQQGSSFPGQQRLAHDLSTTERTIRRALDELKRFKLIDWKRRGLSQTNIYYILSLSNAQMTPRKAERTRMSDKEDSETLNPDEYLRNSNDEIVRDVGKAQKPTVHATRALAPAPEPDLSNRPARARKAIGDFTSVGRTLAARTGLVIPPPASHTGASASERLRACIAEIAQEFGDSRQLRSNLTQALHLLHQSGLSEPLFVSRLYESRAITKDRRTFGSGKATVSKPMAYFWTVVRDEVGIHPGNTQAMSSPDMPNGPQKRERGEKGINGRVIG
jgi:hypothetical protein